MKVIVSVYTKQRHRYIKPYSGNTAYKWNTTDSIGLLYSLASYRLTTVLLNILVSPSHVFLTSIRFRYSTYLFKRNPLFFFPESKYKLTQPSPPASWWWWWVTALVLSLFGVLQLLITKSTSWRGAEELGDDITGSLSYKYCQILKTT
jgi:hypothetical protein